MFLVTWWRVKPLGSGGCSSSRWGLVQCLWAAFPCWWSSGAWPVRMWGEEERFGFESPGFISGCWDVRLWEKHKYSLREVADSEVLARGDAEWICLWQLHTCTSWSPGFQGSPLSVWISFGSVSEVTPSAPNTTVVLFFSECVVK